MLDEMLQKPKYYNTLAKAMFLEYESSFFCYFILIRKRIKFLVDEKLKKNYIKVFVIQKYGTYFEAFHQVISSSILLLFLKSGYQVCKYSKVVAFYNMYKALEIRNILLLC